MLTRECLQRVIDGARDFALIATDVEGRISEWNSGAQRLFGWSSDEICNAPVLRLLGDEDVELFEDEKRNALERGFSKVEGWQVRKSGQRFWASIETLPLRNDAAELMGFVKVVRDCTDSHETGEHLQRTLSRFRTLLNTIETAFAIVQVEFNKADRPINYRFLEANPAFERQAGVDLQGKWVTEFAPDLEPFWFETYGRVALTGEPATFESYAKAFNRWFDVRAIRVGQPEERQIAIFFNDVTARKDAEERLRASEALAREYAERVQLALAAGAIVGTWHWDLTQDRFAVDEAFAQAFGLDPTLGREGLSLNQIVATVHPEDRAGLMAAIDEVVKRSGPYAHQYRVRRADGRYHWIEANGRVEHSPQGVPLRFPGVLIDVGMRRAVEEERDRAAAELRALNDTLEQRVAERTAELMSAEEMLRQAQKMEAVGQLTGGIAHDFNNLLAGIGGALQMMHARATDKRFDDIDRYIAIADGGVKRAAALTHRLLAFSRRQTLSPKPTNVSHLVEGMEELIRRTIGPEIALIVDAEEQLWNALVDPGQLENALLNLCINARDAMADGGEMTIRTSNCTLNRGEGMRLNLADGEYVVLTVTDAGAGIAPEMLDKVFEPFFTTKPLGQGTGLGLSMIQGFVQQSGGQIRIESEVGVGTQVWLYMPRHIGDVDFERKCDEAGAASSTVNVSVLVVEDEPDIRALVVECLQEVGYAVLEASNGAEGLALLRSDAAIELLVSDVGLPGGMNGRQMADAGREVRPDLKVLFITGYAETRIFGSGGLDVGMAVLTKPFQFTDLISAIETLLAAPARQEAGCRGQVAPVCKDTAIGPPGQSF